MKALWKQEEALHPAFQRFHQCLADDWFLLPHEIRLQRAHATALHAAGILDDAERKAIHESLGSIAEEFSDAPAPNDESEDLHTWIEGKLTMLAGDAGRRIHTARSRNDQVATLLKLHVIESGAQLDTKLRSLIATLCERSLSWADLQFPLQTHAQFAAPGSVGSWSMRYATAFHRALERLAFHRRQWQRHCPLGCGAVAGSSIELDRTIQARELGFEQPSPNALDSTTTRDECLELLALAAHIALHLQSLATDVIGFAQTPFGWVRLPSGFATGSSMMPNKSNPDALELLRGEACALIANHEHAMLLVKGLPSGYNRDLQCIKPIVRDAAERLLGLTELADAFMKSLEFEPGRLAEAIGSGDIQATLRMERRVREGQTLRDAHHAEAEASHNGATFDPTLDATCYATTGSASPAEVRRTAKALLAALR